MKWVVRGRRNVDVSCAINVVREAELLPVLTIASVSPFAVCAVQLSV